MSYQLINNYTKKQAEDIYSFIQIGNVRGLLKSDFSLSLNADYKNLIDGWDWMRTVQNAAAFFGRAAFTTGITTLKTYRGGSHITISPNFLVVDWEGNGEVLRSADSLFKYLLPGDPLKRQTQQINKATKKGEETLNTINSLTPNTEKSEKNENGPGLKSIYNAGKGTNIFSKMPPWVTVNISNFFSLTDMIVTSAKVDFSKEMGIQGPLYGDFSATIEQAWIPEEVPTGINTNIKKGPRVIQIGGQKMEIST